MLKNNIIIAIDGPAGAGKSTIAREIASRLNFLYLNSGAMYRSITLLSLRENIDQKGTDELVELAKNCTIDFSHNGKVTLLNGEDISSAIRSPEVERRIAEVAKIPGVRSEMIKQQRRIAKNGGVVAEGRDVTTVVFPHADRKFFITANVKTRGERRFAEMLEKGLECSLDEVTEEIRKRDLTDRSRKESPLRQSEEATLIDTTNLNIEEATDRVMEKVYDGSA